MASLHLDHNVSLNLAAPLRAAGHDIATARDLGLTRSTDDAQLVSAVRAGRVLLTHNRRDFTLLHDAWVTWPSNFHVVFPAHPRILVVDVAPLEELASAVIAVFSGIPPPAWRMASSGGVGAMGGAIASWELDGTPAGQLPYKPLLTDRAGRRRWSRPRG